MTKLKLWQVDAFASKVLEGNPAAVVPLQTWLPDDLMQRLAAENNLAETAFFVKTGPGHYDLRWFTPAVEVDLCGHATLASAFVLFNFIDTLLQKVRFMTRSGELVVERAENGHYSMSLPSDPIEPYEPSSDYRQQIGQALDSRPPLKVFKGRNILAVFESASVVEGLRGPGDIARTIPADKGFIATSIGWNPSCGYDFVSRFFAPHHGVAEDPVTGSAHCALTPFWAAALGKKTMKARQISARGGDLTVTDAGERTILVGDCALYMTGEFEV